MDYPKFIYGTGRKNPLVYKGLREVHFKTGFVLRGNIHYCYRYQHAMGKCLFRANGESPICSYFVTDFKSVFHDLFFGDIY